MKLICDLCGGEIKLSADGLEGLCPECGMLYSGEALQEKLQQAGPAVSAPEEPLPPAPAAEPEGPVDIVLEEVPPKKPARPAGNSAARPAGKPAAKAKNKYKPMWIMLIIIAMFAFWGTIFCPNGMEGVVFLLSLIALLITLTIFRPWKG